MRFVFRQLHFFFLEQKTERTATPNRSPIKIKNKITTFGVVDIWRNMTVLELANELNKDLGLYI